MNDYTPVIGLEIHVELATKSKMFCQCAADWFGKDPNSNTCPVCLGMPGALPVPNKKAIEWTIMIAQALGCTINKVSKFDRKHYFYPDLPKGYQISQYDEPIGVNGKLTIGEKTFGIIRVHLEEDTGKLTHSGTESLVDFNRSGVPLVEIVTEPDFTSSEDAKRFLEELHAIITALGVSDASMQEGSMRLEPNISLKKKGETKLPSYKVEVKNINSFRYVAQAIEYEIKRQKELLEKGKMPAQETRGYNENKRVTFSQRSKEEAQDYRYFPEPDIPPLVFEEGYLKDIEHQIPELPMARKLRLISIYKLSESNAEILSRSKETAEKFEEVLFYVVNDPIARTMAKNLVKGDCTSGCFEKHIKPASQALCEVCVDIFNPYANLAVNKKIDLTQGEALELAKQATEMLLKKEIDPSFLQQALKKVTDTNEKAVSDFKAGKEASLMFLVGQVMRELKGKADATKVKKELLKKLQ